MMVRERMVAYGTASLSDAELVGLVLGVSFKVAEELLRQASCVEGLAFLSTKEIAEAAFDSTISPTSTDGEQLHERLHAALELARRMAPPTNGKRITSSRDVICIFQPRLGHLDVEEFWVVGLDAKNRPIFETLVGRGGITSCPVAVADVLRSLVQRAAAATIFVHNHPSGDTTPSPEDVALTERLARGGDLIGIRVVDHIIVGSDGYFSFLDAGLLDVQKS